MQLSQQTKVGETKNFQRLKKKTQIIGNKKHIEGGKNLQATEEYTQALVLIESYISFICLLAKKSVEEVEI